MCLRSLYSTLLYNYETKHKLDSLRLFLHACARFTLRPTTTPPHPDWLFPSSTPASIPRSAFLINEAYLNNVQALGLEPISCQGTMINRNALLIIIITLTCAFLLEGLISADLENLLRRRSKACYYLPQMVV